MLYSKGPPRPPCHCHPHLWESTGSPARQGPAEAALACCSLWRPELRAERATRIQPPPPPPAMPPLRSWQQQELLAPAPASSLLDLGAEHTLPTQKCRADARGGSGRDSAVLLVAAAQGDMEGPWPLGTVWSRGGGARRGQAEWTEPAKEREGVPLRSCTARAPHGLMSKPQPEQAGAQLGLLPKRNKCSALGQGRNTGAFSIG